METIIGLGKAGCRIADRFAQYPQYDVYKMDVGLKRTPRTYGLKAATSPRRVRGFSWKSKKISLKTLRETSCLSYPDAVKSAAPPCAF